MNEPESLHEQTVLIIEDQPSVARAIARVLSSKFNVRIATDIEQGFMLVTNSKIDLVLLDVCLPGRSALDFCQIVKADLDLKSLPIIMVSGLRPLGDKVRGLEFGSDSYLSKPFFVEELRARVSATLERIQERLKTSSEYLPCPPDTVHFTFEADTIDLEFTISPN